MTTYNTGNPIGSTDPRDLYDNAENFDTAINSQTSTYVDRKGVTRKTLWKAVSDIQVGAPMYADTTAGLAATTNGQYFSTPSALSTEFMVLYKNNAGVALEVKTFPSGEVVEDIYYRTIEVNQQSGTDRVWGIVDEGGNAAMSVRESGETEIQDLKSNLIYQQSAVGFDFAISDDDGNVAFGIKEGTGEYYPPFAIDATSLWNTLDIGSDDTIVHIGDSYTAAHYVLKDKAYISQLSQLSPYRHINFGVSGNDALDMQYRIVNDSAYDGITFDNMNAKYAFITTLTNDGQFRSADLSYYKENVKRLVETVRATGTEPVITTEFPATALEHALLRNIADEYGCSFIDCTTYNTEVGGLQLGPFHQGHPGTRTGGVFWLPMLDFIDKMPAPERAIKIYRKRSTFTPSSIADLLFTDRIEKAKRWKELTVAHYSLNPANKFEELSQLGTFTYDWQSDEYSKLRSGQAISLPDYALIELTLPGTAVTLDAVKLELGVSGDVEVFVRNYLDVPASMPGRAQGMTPTNSTYLSKWNKPRGAWKSLGHSTSEIIIHKADLKTSMQGSTLQFMLVGNVTINSFSASYQGRLGAPKLKPVKENSIIGSELVQQPLCGTSGQLSSWNVVGSPTIVVPIDVYNAPTKPGTSSRVDGVCTITSSNHIGQTVTLPAHEGRVRKYMLTVWARYFPKAFLDPSLYPSLDTSQIINRITYPNDATITTNTDDLRTLRLEIWGGTSYPDAGGAEFIDFATLQWRPINFVFEAAPYIIPNQLSFGISCTDGEIQIAKVSFREVM